MPDTHRLVPCRNTACPHASRVEPVELRLFGETTLVVPLCDACTAAADAAERERHVAGLIERSRAPATMRGWSFTSFPDDPEAREARRAGERWLEDYLAGEAGNLLLTGQTGVGKSGLAWAVVRAVCEHGHDACFLNIRDYLWEVRNAYRERGQVNDRPHWVGLLALDDLGAERPTDFAREELATLVEHRHGRGLPTIVTSNYPPSELVKRLGHDDLLIGQRIVSRLVEDATQVRVLGPDRRLR